MRFQLRPSLRAHEEYVVTVLMLAMVAVPWLALIWPAVARQLGIWWVDACLRTGVILLTALAVGALLRRSAKFGSSVTLPAYSHAFVRLGLVWTAGGLLVLATGRVPSKIIHGRIARHDSVIYFGIGAVLALVGVVCGFIAERSRRRG
jgi:hypothetical protein